MAATVWKGYISFGLVSIPVRLYGGARGKTVGFHLIHKTDNSRVHEVMYCDAEDKPVKRSELVKGYEFQKGRYVTVTPEEIKKVTPATGEAMELIQFVKAEKIDPIFFETSYYVAPEVSGQKPYALLLEALRQTGYEGLAKVTMHGREHLVTLRPSDRGIMLYTMYYADEIRDAPEFAGSRSLVKEAELKMAKTLVESMAGDFKPKQYSDTYRENLEKLIAAKAKGKEVAAAPQPKIEKVTDIMEALRRSLTEAKASRSKLSSGKERPATRKRRIRGKAA
jgi:DNA end-binding protein Ku